MSDTCRFRQAVESRDDDAVAASLSPEVVLHSPVLFKPFVGRDTAMFVLRLVKETLEDFVYESELAAGAQTALVFRARVGSRELEGVDLLTHDSDGLVTELTVFMRPMSALTAFSEAMGARLPADVRG